MIHGYTLVVPINKSETAEIPIPAKYNEEAAEYWPVVPSSADTPFACWARRQIEIYAAIERQLIRARIKAQLVTTGVLRLSEPSADLEVFLDVPIRLLWKAHRHGVGPVDWFEDGPLQEWVAQKVEECVTE